MTLISKRFCHQKFHDFHCFTFGLVLDSTCSESPTETPASIQYLSYPVVDQSSGYVAIPSRDLPFSSVFFKK